MAIVVHVSSCDESLKFASILRVGKVDDINRNFVSLQHSTEIFALLHVLLDWMSTEGNDSLLLILVLSVLEC